MKTPRVSIVIPCYNAARWVAEAIQSCLAQTYKPIEIIVVDDGSRDDSLAVARRFESEWLKVISQENRGNGAARNRGLTEAQGEFIQYLDADDLLAPDKIEVQMRRLSNEPEPCLASGAWAHFQDSVADAVFRVEPVWKDLPPVDWLVTSWRRGGVMACHAWLVPRSLADKAGAWNENICRNVDGEYFTRVILQSRRVLFCPEARVFYRSNATGVSGNLSDRGLTDTFRSFELCLGYLLAVEDSARTRLAGAGLFQQFIYDAYPEVPELVRLAEIKVAELGGCEFKLRASSLFNLLADVVGWRLAKRLQLTSRRLRGM